MNTRLMAIYLPQFHCIPENDEWWGNGFTEWVNVKRGKAFYPGHYQPREPLDDNYYDLSDLKVLEKHTRMARRAGINGFCFYHYYFCGKKLLEKPIENYRDNSKETFPYCLIWANQSWARTWYRANVGKSILLQQTYGERDEWKKHFEYLLSFFKDERYIKINNKPVYIIYLPQEIRCRKEMFSLWNVLAKENGFAGIYLIAMNTSIGKDNKSNYYDAYMDFEPMCSMKNDNSYRRFLQKWKSNYLDRIQVNEQKRINRLWVRNAYSYTYLCRTIEKRMKHLDEKTMIGVFSGWDNTARKDQNGVVVEGSSPNKFYRHLKKVLKYSNDNKKEFVIINAWNEWSEGAYIEPDKKYRYNYLKAIKLAVDAIREY